MPCEEEYHRQYWVGGVYRPHSYISGPGPVSYLGTTGTGLDPTSQSRKGYSGGKNRLTPLTNHTLQSSPRLSIPLFTKLRGWVLYPLRVLFFGSPTFLYTPPPTIPSSCLDLCLLSLSYSLSLLFWSLSVFLPPRLVFHPTRAGIETHPLPLFLRTQYQSLLRLGHGEGFLFPRSL